MFKSDWDELQTSLSDLDVLAVIFGAMIHDYQHTGHTNNFHIQAGFVLLICLFVYEI